MLGRGLVSPTVRMICSSPVSDVARRNTSASKRRAIPWPRCCSSTNTPQIRGLVPLPCRRAFASRNRRSPPTWRRQMRPGRSCRRSPCRQTLTEDLDRSRAMLFGGLAEGARLLFESLQTQAARRPRHLAPPRVRISIVILGVSCMLGTRRASVCPVMAFAASLVMRLDACLLPTLRATAPSPGPAPVPPSRRRFWPTPPITRSTTSATCRTSSVSKPLGVSRTFTGRDEWRPLDIIVERLTYFEHHEDYKVIEINGQSVQHRAQQAGRRYRHRANSAP